MTKTEHAEWLAAYDVAYSEDFWWKSEKELFEMRAKSTGGNREFEIVEAGNHIAILYQIVDCGMQPGSSKYPDPKPEVRFGFELPGQQVTYEKDGQEVSGPMSIGQNFSFFMSPRANLRKFVESMTGKTFPSDKDAEEYDVSALIGSACLLNVVHNEGKNGKTYANIASAAPLPAGMEAPEQHNPSVVFDLDNPSDETLSKLPRWLQEKIENRVDNEPADVPPTPPVEAYADSLGDPDQPIPF